MNKLVAMLSLSLMLFGIEAITAGDWITAPSYYTHDPSSGERVTQYSPIGPFYTYAANNFVKSGFRQSRSTIQVGSSTDNYITSEKWGEQIRPFGEWRYPYRPNSVPYDQWGPQYYGGVYPGYSYGLGYGGGLGGGLGGGGFPGGGILPSNQGGGRRSAQPRPNPLQPGYTGRQQLLDGRYPPFDNLDPFERQQVLDHYYPAPPTN